MMNVGERALVVQYRDDRAKGRSSIRQRQEIGLYIPRLVYRYP